jgi:hypothetical protein
MVRSCKNSEITFILYSFGCKACLSWNHERSASTRLVCNCSSELLEAQVSDRVPVSELGDLMRAIGFFPSEYQIQVGATA